MSKVTDDERKKIMEKENYQKQKTRKEKKIRGLYCHYILTFDNDG